VCVCACVRACVQLLIIMDFINQPTAGPLCYGLHGSEDSLNYSMRVCF